MNKLPIVAFFAYTAFIQSVNSLDILDEISRLNSTNENDVNQLLSTLDNGYGSPFYNMEDAIRDRYIIFFHNGSDVKLIMETFGARVEKFDKTFAIHFLYEMLDAACASMSQLSFNILRQMPQVEFIENDAIVDMIAEAPPEQQDEETCTTQQNSGWCLARISNEEKQSHQVFNYPTIGGNGVPVYVMDTGIQKEHSDFGGRVQKGPNYVKTESCDDLNGHGTACASLVGGQLSGVAKKATLVNVKVLDQTGKGQTSAIVAGFNWITKQKGIISVSFGGPGSYVLDVTVNRVYKWGHVIVVAAGNDNHNANNTSPARAKHAFTVGASNQANKLASFSNYGNVVDIIAPGEHCKAANSKTGGYKTFSGTSIATPLVAGVAALLKSMNPEATHTELTSLKHQTSLQHVISNLKGSSDRFLHIECAV